MLKKTTLLIAFLGLFAFATQAQRIAVVDVQAVLENMEEYKSAQAELENISTTWRQEITQQYDQIKGLYSSYQSEAVLLSDKQKTQREEEIMSKEKRVRDLQRKRFGPEGSLFKKRQELVQPLQDKIYKAIKGYMEDRGFDIILDKSQGGVLANNPRIEKTADLMKRLGIN